MADPAIISVANLSKRYLLSRRSAGGSGLRHALEEWLKRPFSGPRPRSAEEFWALREVSFDIAQGEIVGVIGRNGAGKSTLLKIISRITDPTVGRITLRGRVASLLEVGTGFHPELTGRENIFLNGAILGLTRSEVRARFDEIVAFAGIEPFLDTPVKRYSSGMYVRLAFAVAAHLEPEILLIDEVLAVGDAEFQKKCLGKMTEVSRQHGRTVLFVSHNLPAVTQLCGKALLLERGRLARAGRVDEILGAYFQSCASDAAGALAEPEREELRRRKQVFFTEAALLGGSGEPAADLDVRHPFRVRIRYEVPRPLRRIELSFRVLTSDGRAVFTSLQSALQPEALQESRAGEYECEVEVPGMFLMPGAYFINLAAHEPAGELFDLRENILSFTIQDTGTMFAPYQHYQQIGVVLKDLAWQQRKLH